MKNTPFFCPKCKADNCIYNDTCIKCEAPLIGDEARLLDETAKLWNKFISLPQQHPDEFNEVKDAIHRIQDLIAVRMARKLTGGIFR